MELKKWVDYSLSEKQVLLDHLFTYYGKSLYNLEELETYSHLTSMIPDTLFNIFVYSYLTGVNGQTVVLEVLRNENELQETLLKEKAGDYDATDISDYENEFLAEIIKTYNNPEPVVPLSDEEIKRQLAKMFGH